MIMQRPADSLVQKKLLDDRRRCILKFNDSVQIGNTIAVLN